MVDAIQKAGSKLVMIHFFLSLFFLKLIFVFSGIAAEKPNILFVLFDDMGYGEPTSYRSNSLFKTPNIDRMAKGGMRFTDAHSSAAPVVHLPAMDF